MILLVVWVGAVIEMNRAEPARQVLSTDPGAAVELLTSLEDLRIYRVQVGDTRPVYVAVQGQGEAPQTTWFTGKNDGHLMEQLLTVTRK
jgi:hypothetical protein